MAQRRAASMARVLPHKADSAAVPRRGPDAPRRVRNTVINFTALALPPDVRLALAEAFWSHFGAHSTASVLTRWYYIKTFDRFAQESHIIGSVADLNTELLARLIEWLNRQTSASGKPWGRNTRAAMFGTVRTLLRWIERCKRGVINNIEYPFNPFPYRNRDSAARSKPGPRELRAILAACEEDIARSRATRATARAARITDEHNAGTLGWLLAHIDQHHQGVIPSSDRLARAGGYPLYRALQAQGGSTEVERYLYPNAESLVPYYLAIVIHTAGNPDAIISLRRDCLQPVPLLDDRQALVWAKPRAGRMQRRTFKSSDPFEPPALVAELVEWNQHLQALVSPALRDRLFLHKNKFRFTALSGYTARRQVQAFCQRHRLPRFSLSSLRPAVLTSFYRATGDLRRVGALANHAHLSTTVRYVQTPEVEAQHRVRVAALQSAFIGHLEKTDATDHRKKDTMCRGRSQAPAGKVISMFGFDCADPMAGVAPGTHPGQMCTHFMGCFTCPNAIITSDAATVARLLQARDHFRDAQASLHPARWDAFYAPQLRILDEDILPRFDAAAVAAGQALQARLPPLPELR